MTFQKKKTFKQGFQKANKNSLKVEMEISVLPNLIGFINISLMDAVKHINTYINFLLLSYQITTNLVL